MDIAKPDAPRRRVVWWGSAAAVSIAALAVWSIAPRAAVPRIALAGLVLDTARVGDLRREVRAPGQLQASRAFVISTATAGRVDAILTRLGSAVSRGTELMQLSNPDVEMGVLEAQRQVAAADAAAAALALQLESAAEDRQRFLVALRTELADAVRTRDALQALAQRGYSSPNEVARSVERASDLAERLRLSIDGNRTQLEGQLRRMTLERETVQRLRALAAGQLQRLIDMRVLATDSGVVQELRVEVGQWATIGQPLARVADASALRAALKVPEAQVRELAVGQIVRIESRAADAGSWTVRGRVSRIAPSVTSGTVVVDVALSESPPTGAARDLAIDGVVEVEHVTRALTIARPGAARPGAAGVLYRLSRDGTQAVRTEVTFGRASYNRVEVVSGIAAGDVVIVSDLPVEGSPSAVGLRR